MGITIRLLKEDEAALANNFFNKVYKTARSFDNFKWEFIDSPFGKAIYVVAVDDSYTSEVKIVGIQCAIPIELIHSGGAKILTAKSEDTLVDPGYRGQKIFERMYDLLFEECRGAGIKYIWGFTPAEKAFSRLGFSIPFKAQQALAVFNVGKAYRYLSTLNPANDRLAKSKILALCLASRVKQTLSWSNVSAGYSLEPAAFGELNIHFQKFCHDNNLYSLNFSPAFVRWRFSSNPNGNDYRNYILRNRGEVVANIVLNIRHDVSYIERIIAKDPGHLSAAIRLSTRQLQVQNADLVRVLGFDNNDATGAQLASLRDNGFVTLARGSYFVWKSLHSDEDVRPNDLFLDRIFTQGNL
jgi:hypothetical protein